MNDREDLDRRLTAQVQAGLAKRSRKRGGFMDLEYVVGPDPIQTMTPFEPRVPKALWALAMRAIAAARTVDLRGSAQYAARRCESPIEEVFLLALLVAAQARVEEADQIFVDAFYDSRTKCGGRLFEPEPFSAISRFRIAPQVTVGEYRADFLVTVWLWNAFARDSKEWEWRCGSIVIECDGHDFHEKTKEQAQHDKARDRELQRHGYQVFRFTGSEVWADCLQCADEALESLERYVETRQPLATRPRPKL